MLIFTHCMQVYIVSGCRNGQCHTETLEKDGGSAWQLAASLPSARGGYRGLGLDHGRFIVAGECWTILLNYCKLNPSFTAGGWNRNWFTDVVIYDSEEDEWTTVGHLSTARSFHGISLVPGNTVDFCL